MTGDPNYLESIFACMMEGVVYQDHTGVIRRWNPSAERILGLSGDQLTGRTSHDPRWRAVHEDGSPFLGDEHPAMVTIRTGQPLSGVTMGIQKPDGTVTWILVNSRPMALDGGPPGALTTFVDVTERERMERALRVSEARYRGLFRSSPDGVVIIDASGRIVEANEGQQSMFRATADELVGLPATELIDPADRERAAQIMWRRLAGEQVPAVEYTLLRRDGTTFPGETTAAILRDDQQRVSGYICVTRDTSARQAEEKMLAERQAFDALMLRAMTRFARTEPSTSACPFVDVLEDTARFLEAEHAVVATFSRDRTRFDRVYEWCAPGVLPLADWMRAATVAELPWMRGSILANHVVRVDCGGDRALGFTDPAVGNEHEATDRLVVPITADGVVIGGIGIHHHRIARPWRDEDVARLTLIGNTLAVALERFATEERYRLLAEQTADDIWLYDLKAERFTYVSPAVRRQRGFSPDEVIEAGSLHSQFVGHEGDAILESLKARILALARGVESARSAIYMTQMRRRDGSALPVEIATTLIADANGRATHMQGVTRDISERLTLQAQLQHAQKLEAVGRLAGGVAHDFNNLLGAIIGNAEMALLSLGADDAARQDIEEIITAANKAAGVTAQLLAFARQQPSRPVTLDLNQTVEGMLKLLRRLIGEDIVLEWKPQATAWPALADPVQVDQILANLAVNARDAMSRTGTLTIATSTRTVVERAEAPDALQPGDYVVLSVQDTGTGMTPEVLQRAFEPFFTTKESGKGTGLGLSMVYGIARQHGGGVEIDTAPGIGTTVRVFFPRAVGTSQSAGDTGRPGPAARGAETLLVVEDSDMLRVLATRALTGLGYRVLAAETPVRALELASAHDGPIHLLLSDVVMPGMNGRELQRAFGQIRPDAKTLFMSGYTADVISQQGALDPREPLLHKPFSMQTLAAAVRAALDR